MSSNATIDRGAEILARAVEPQTGDWSREAADAIGRVKLSEFDTQRVNDLAAKAREGTLSADERSELDEYERVASLIELLQSKARRSVKSSSR